MRSAFRVLIGATLAAGCASTPAAPAPSNVYFPAWIEKDELAAHSKPTGRPVIVLEQHAERNRVR